MNKTKKPADRLIFHVDVNSAFLSWESARRMKEGLPDLRDIPGKKDGYRCSKVDSGEKMRCPDRRACGNGTAEMPEYGYCSQ